MDNSISMDSLNDTTPLPELSFDDLLDVSPVKKIDNSVNSDDQIVMESNDLDSSDNVLNTPVTKKFHNVSDRAALIIAKTKTNEDHSQMSAINVPSPLANATVPTKVVPTSLIVNNKNQIVKLATKLSTSTATTSSASTIATTAISPMTIAGKTAIKTASGKIIYLQKNITGQLPSVRLQTTGANTGKSTTSNLTTSNTPKPVAIQVVRTADGSFVPVKTVPSANNAAKLNTIKISSSALASSGNVTGKKFLTTTGGQVVIKAPLTPISGAAIAAIQKASLANSNANPTAVAKTKDVHMVEPSKSSNDPSQNDDSVSTPLAASSTTDPTASTLVGNTTITKTCPSPVNKIVTTTVTTCTNLVTKTLTTSGTTIATTTAVGSKGQNFLVKTANGKPIVVSNQNIIKLSPKVVQNNGAISIKGTIPTSNGGQLRAIQIPGKPGKQWVRVLPQNKISTSAVSNVSSTVSTSVVNVSVAGSGSTSGSGSGSGSGSSSAFTTACSKAMNLTNSTSTLSTSSPIKSINAVPQKFTIVRPVNSSKIVLTKSPKIDISNTTIISKIMPVTSASMSSSSVTADGIPGTTTNAASSNGRTNVDLKSKITDLNSEIRRIIGAGGLKEITTVDLNNVDKQNKKRIVLMPVARLNTAQGASSVETFDSKLLPKMVLKTNNSPEDEKAQMKSLLICGKAKALMVQKQQYKKKEQVNVLDYDAAVDINELNHMNDLLNNVNSLDSEIDEKKSDAYEEPQGAVRRKHCNCSKSQCLKLYCDCFANGEFCKDCTCKDCCNNLENEDERQRAIRTCLERNPSAFKPKITTASDYGDTRLHNKGCNCKRSSCLKNYCECYEAKIPCSSNCKCVGCRNVEDRPDLDMDPHSNADNANSLNKGTIGANITNGTFRKREYENSNQKSEKIKTESGVGASKTIDGQPSEKRPCNIITQEVFEATIQCLISQADECEKKNDPPYDYITKEHMVIKEVGRCLEEILSFSLNMSDKSFSQE